MLNKLGYLIILMLGVGLGMALEWVYSHQATQDTSHASHLLENVLTHAHVHITQDNYACDGEPVRTVGAVFASIVALNARHNKNRLSYGCFKEICTISHNDCKPWQSAECSSRFLKFQITETGNINTHSFSCIDMP